MVEAFSPDKPLAALLVSYWYLKGFQHDQASIACRNWVMDSGAYSAKNSGVEIDLQAFIATCKELTAADPLLTECFGLDVIGDAKETRKNVERMWKAGVEAIPTYHRGEPEEYLQHYAKNYPKIALGGVADLRGAAKSNWIQQCFARVWPKKIHGFGVSGEADILAAPWHSVDSTSWVSPHLHGNWRSMFKGTKHTPRIPDKAVDTRTEVDWYLALERRAQHRWAKQLAELN